MKLFIELCKARESWNKLEPEARSRFLSPVGYAMQQLDASGGEIVAWGANEQTTPERAPYDFVAVFKFPNAGSALNDEQVFRDAGWYDYFEQVNVMGNIESYERVLAMLIDL